MLCREMANWIAPGKDGLQGYWLKNVTSLHPRIAMQLNHILDEGRPWPDWKNSTVPNGQGKSFVVDKYRPIPCLSLMWKLMTGIFDEKMYNHLKKENVLPSKQKGCCKGNRYKKETY